MYGCVPPNQGDLLILVANISPGYKIAVLLNRANDALERHCLIEARTTDVRKNRFGWKSRVFSI